MYLYPYKKPETFSYRCLKKIDIGAFKQDLSHAVSQVSSISDYNNHLCSVLDKYAPLCHCTVRTRKPTPWFSSIAERWQAGRRWLKSKLTVHKQIYDSIKQKVTNLGAGIAQWLERRTRDRKVAGSNPCWSGGRIFFFRVNFLC